MTDFLGEDYAFGPLTATGRTRKAALARILPSLSIADRCELRERCLVVRGGGGALYEIHLGTGNVRDEDGRVVTSGASKKNSKKDAAPALPFEGDALLAGILTRAQQLAR